MNKPGEHQIRVFTFVGQIEVLLVWLIFSLLYWLIALLYSPDELGVRAYLAGILFAITFMPLIQYGFIIVEYTARGHDVIPRMSVGIFSMDARMYRFIFIGTLLAAGFFYTPEAYQLITISIILIFTPAMTSFIAFHTPISGCVNPINLVRFIKNMGATYIVLRLLANTIMLVLLYFFQRGEQVFGSMSGSFFMMIAATYLLLTMFRGTGALLHLRHAELGIQTDFSQKQAEGALRHWEEKEHRKLAIRLCKLEQRGKTEAAWTALQDFLGSSEFANSELLRASLQERGSVELIRRLDLR
jgi:hypothetical protein